MSADDAAFPPSIPTGVPTPARVYDYLLGGKDNYAVDREFALSGIPQFPETLDIARENRHFLYRVVRYLARDVGIRQFLDMGSGLPTQNNVHEVAQTFQPGARVVYVDMDPIVLAHGRALLADEKTTTVITANLTDPETILQHPDTLRLLDFNEPVAALFLSVPHSIPDDEQARRPFQALADTLASGSYLGVSQFSTEDPDEAEAHSAFVNSLGLTWKTRTPTQIRALVSGWEPAGPGLGDVQHLLPDPGQPPLNDVDAPLRPFLGAAHNAGNLVEFGGVLRLP